MVRFQQCRHRGLRPQRPQRVHRLASDPEVGIAKRRDQGFLRPVPADPGQGDHRGGADLHRGVIEAAQDGEDRIGEPQLADGPQRRGQRLRRDVVRHQPRQRLLRRGAPLPTRGRDRGQEQCGVIGLTAQDGEDRPGRPGVPRRPEGGEDRRSIPGRRGVVEQPHEPLDGHPVGRERRIFDGGPADDRVRVVEGGVEGRGRGRRAGPVARPGGAGGGLAGILEEAERAQPPPEAVPLGRHPVQVEQRPVGRRPDGTRQTRAAGEPRQGRDQRDLVRLAQGQPRAVAHGGPVVGEPLDDAVPGGGVAAADPVEGRDGRVPDEPILIAQPLPEGRHDPGRAGAAEGGRGLEADGGIGVLEPREQAVAGLGHAARPELSDGLGPDRGVSIAHGAEDGGPGRDTAVDGVEGPDRVPRACRGAPSSARRSTSGRTASRPRSARRRCATILTLRAGWERPRTSSPVEAWNSRPIAAGMYQAGLGAAALAPR